MCVCVCVLMGGVPALCTGLRVSSPLSINMCVCLCTISILSQNFPLVTALQKLNHYHWF